MATERLAGNLASAMLNQDDPDTVRAGAPAYLLLLDGLIRQNPDDRALLVAGSRLYGAFATGLITEPKRVKRLTQRSREYAQTAFCARYATICEEASAPFDRFAETLDQIDPDDLPLLYAYATSWAGWIAARHDDWSALADLPKVEQLLERIIAQDPGYDHGRAQLYLGVMRSQLPPALGGKPETGRTHFELAITYSKGRDLIAKVEYAQHYARLMFDQPLHDRLLHEVLAAPAQEPDLTLSNILAKQQAEHLLKDEYF
ncbi:TRAP transporter TatT component family protein [Sedimenticola sp.]|uniref:TRAP transporter TatT component family protein n=1 Tax=Sedimenticola sp. TaxID=1940285 RepID=UPI003D0C8A70